MKIKVVVPVLRNAEAGIGGGREGSRGKSMIERESQGFVVVEEELEVVEEDEEESGDEEGRDALVDHLFEQLREMKTRVSSCGVADMLNLANEVVF